MASLYCAHSALDAAPGISNGDGIAEATGVKGASGSFRTTVVWRVSSTRPAVRSSSSSTACDPHSGRSSRLARTASALASPRSRAEARRSSAPEDHQGDHAAQSDLAHAVPFVVVTPCALLQTAMAARRPKATGAEPAHDYPDDAPRETPRRDLFDELGDAQAPAIVQHGSNGMVRVWRANRSSRRPGS
jgi:hypothetical protein